MKHYDWTPLDVRQNLALGNAAEYRFMDFAIPARMFDGINRWIERGIYPGDFLTAVIENDLSRAVSHADAENMRNLPAYVGYFYNKAPAGCWGSRERAKRWNAQGGIEGYERQLAFEKGETE